MKYGDEATLPKWVQKKLSVLRQDLEAAQARADVFTGTKSRVSLGASLRRGIGEQYLPEEPVQFEVEPDVFVRVLLDGDHIKVQGTGMQRYRLQVEPQYANLVFIRVAP